MRNGGRRGESHADRLRLQQTSAGCQSRREAPERAPGGNYVTCGYRRSGWCRYRAYGALDLTENGEGGHQFGAISRRYAGEI